ncbi:hypothetical protein H5410_064764 [Solanum commersonii]|uniref:Uncharacterized protein n=1 Tax=Solanum commersonii TaxID=4109 RepID=A0A9J5VYG7_SOLCO|nr:hypothetical protein H5410_064764 [Solanum commersonii]
MQASALTKPFQPCQSRPVDLVATRWRHAESKSVGLIEVAHTDPFVRDFVGFGRNLVQRATPWPLKI